MPSCTKPDSWVATATIILLVAKNTNSCFGTRASGINSIEPFFVTVELQGGLWANQWLPRATTQWGFVVLPFSYQWVQRVGLLVDDDEVNLIADPYTKTDLGERCVPVGRLLGLLWVEPSLPSRKFVFNFVTPVLWVIMKCALRRNRRK